MKGAAALVPTTVDSYVRVHLNVLNNFAGSVGWIATENCSSRYGQGEASLPLLCKTLQHRHLPAVSLNTHTLLDTWFSLKCTADLQMSFWSNSFMPCCFCGGLRGQPAQHTRREAGTLGLRAVLAALRILWEHTLDRLIYSCSSGKAHIWQAVDRLPADVQSPSKPWKESVTKFPLCHKCNALSCHVPVFCKWGSAPKDMHCSPDSLWRRWGTFFNIKPFFSYQGTAHLMWEACGTPVDIAGYMSGKTHRYLRPQALLWLCAPLSCF